MKKMKKLVAMLLSAAMVMGMSLMASATDTDASGAAGSQSPEVTQTPLKGEYPSAEDDTTVTIKGLEGIQEGTIVTLYQIATAEYKTGGQ